MLGQVSGCRDAHIIGNWQQPNIARCRLLRDGAAIGASLNAEKFRLWGPAVNAESLTLARGSIQDSEVKKKYSGSALQESSQVVTTFFGALSKMDPPPTQMVGEIIYICTCKQSRRPPSLARMGIKAAELPVQHPKVRALRVCYGQKPCHLLKDLKGGGQTTVLEQSSPLRLDAADPLLHPSTLTTQNTRLPSQLEPLRRMSWTSGVPSCFLGLGEGSPVRVASDFATA